MNTTNQDPAARPLTKSQAEHLSALPFVSGAWTELNFDGERTIWVELRDGWNYESRPQVVSVNWAETLHNLKSVENEPAAL